MDFERVPTDLARLIWAFVENPYILFMQYVSEGRMEEAKWMKNHMKFSRIFQVQGKECNACSQPLVQAAIFTAAIHNQFTMVEWLQNTLGIMDSEIRFDDNIVFRSLCTLGRTKMLRFLDEQYSFTQKDAESDGNYALRTSAVNCRQETVQWLIHRFNFPRKVVEQEALTPAIREGHRKLWHLILKWMWCPEN